MTKKHFKAMAEIINANLKTYGGDETAKKAIESVACSLSNLCYAVNPRFDHKTFLTACGIYYGYSGALRIQNCRV